MRILFLSPVGFFKGGAERSLFDLLRNPEIEPILAVPEPGPVGEAAAREGVPVHVVPYGRVATIRRPLSPALVLGALRDWLAAARRLKALARESRAQAVHSNGLKAHCIAALSRVIGGPPTVFHLRDFAVRRSEILVWKGLGRIASHMVTVSRPCWPDDTLPANVSVVHNGLVLPPPADVGMPGPRLRLGICGRISPFKGHDTLVDWLAAARDAGIDFELRVRGEAEPGDAAYDAALRARIARLGLGDRIVFDGFREGLAEVYRGLDVVVVPSVVPDPLPRSVMEAMGLGLAVIGYPAGGIPEMIEDGRNGWLARDAERFVAVLRQISGDPAALARTRAAARDTIAGSFSLPHMYSQLNVIYRSITREGPL